MKIKIYIKKTQIIGKFLLSIQAIWKKRKFKNSYDYWKTRYNSNGNSGHDSYGKLEKFKRDKNKKFFLMKKYNSQKTNLGLLLDVIYNLVENHIYEEYMQKLFSPAKKYIIIYSSNTDCNEGDIYDHILHRSFQTWIDNNQKKWKLIKIIPNKCFL